MPQDPPRALIIEDDPSWQAIVSEILADVGLEVDVADGLDAAISSLRATSHRLAVVDLSLGGADHRNQDGLVALDAIRRQDPGCVAIMLTGFATVELAVNALTAHGAISCLRKEAFRRAEFRQIVHQALAIAPVTEQTFEVSENPKGLAVEIPKGLTALVVEDDAGWRGILAELLGEVGVGARPCSSYGEALGLLRREQFSLAVVDLSLASSVAPDGNLDGAHILAVTKAAGIPTLVVSGAATPADVERAYAEHGIFAYLEKQKFDRGAFRRTVGEILRMQTFEVSENLKGLAKGLTTLTEREREVLELLAQGLTNKEMAARLVITTNTVKRHLKSIFEKLGVSTRAGAVAKVPPPLLPFTASPSAPAWPDHRSPSARAAGRPAHR